MSVEQRKETSHMNGKILSLAAASLLLVTAAHAQTSSPNSAAPGQRMQDKGSVPGQPGASGSAPGQQMQQRGSKAGEPGASGYAPGHQGTSGQGGSMGDRNPDRDRGDAR
jgi:hypothetical protein